MGFLDALGIGSGPSQLSLPEILSAIPAIAGPVLMARGKRVGLPLGIGLSAIGGLGQTLADRQRTQGQHQRLADAIGQMPGVSDDQRKFFGQMVQSGVDPNTFLPEVMKGLFPKAAGPVKPMFSMQDGKEIAFDPSKGTKMYDVPGTTSSFQSKGGKGLGISLPVQTELKAMKVNPAEATGEQIAAAEASIAERGAKPSWRTETDPTTGATVQQAYKYNAKSGKMELVPTTGEPGGVPSKLDTNERKQLDAVRLVSTQIPRMNDLVRQLPPDTSPAMLAREYAKFRAPFGAAGTVDPRFSAYFQQIGQLKAALISSAASGFRGQYMIDMLKQHIPSETDPPARAMEKIQGFDKGGFNAVLQNYLGVGSPVARPPEGGGAAGTPPPKPPFEVDKAYQKDGAWYVKDKAGKFYQFDGSKWTPL